MYYRIDELLWGLFPFSYFLGDRTDDGVGSLLRSSHTRQNYKKQICLKFDDNNSFVKATHHHLPTPSLSLSLEREIYGILVWRLLARCRFVNLHEIRVFIMHNGERTWKGSFAHGKNVGLPL